MLDDPPKNQTVDLLVKWSFSLRVQECVGTAMKFEDKVGRIVQRMTGDTTIEPTKNRIVFGYN